MFPAMSQQLIPSPTPTPTSKQALTAVHLLQTYFDCVGDEDCAWMVLKMQDKIEKEALQDKVLTSLHDYFV
jgi:hypothetical protein